MSEKVDWLDKPYYSLNAYMRHVYGKKCYKISVDAGLTCPNRDGTLDNRGCIFCSAGGSGDFAVNIKADVYKRCYDMKKTNTTHMGARRIIDVERQIERGLAMMNKRVGDGFIIYFQAFTNTYGDIDYLRDIYTLALDNPKVVGISIATRPDCLGLGENILADSGVLSLLVELKRKYEPLGKFVWVELGLQTIHESTARYIRRHYSLDMYDKAVSALDEKGIKYITHIILGLPGEDENMMLETVGYVCKKRPFGVKLQLLHVLAGTDLAAEYENGRFGVLGMEEYLQLVIKCLQRIDSDIVVHRVTGDGPKNILIAPKWSANKKLVLNTLLKMMRETGAEQGQLAD